MSNFDLLKVVQPVSGWYALLGIKGDQSPKQYLVETREEVDDITNRLMQQQFNVFFGVAKYKDDSSRKKSNVLALKSFWLDIDCGPKKAEVNPKTGLPAGYIDQKAGLSALQKFCAHVGLPKPIVVNSGRGLHIYWPLTTEIAAEEWEPIAYALRDLCNLHSLHVDAAVFETARVLRIPNTFNFKDDPALPVAVMHAGKPVDVNIFAELVGFVPKPKNGLFGTASVKRGMTALGKSMQDSGGKSFAKIMRRSAKGTGCAQLLDCYNNRSTLSEARWFDALSVAKFCSDKDTAIHKISSGHPDYDPAKTEQKIDHIEGPHNCSTFERNNVGGCAGCPHLGKIKNPIVLGSEVKAANTADRTVMFEHPVTKQTLIEVIPPYPKPYFRGKDGGLWFQPPGDESEPVFVYDRDLYVVKRMRDPVEKDVALVRLHMPEDGVREFVLSNSVISEKGELRKRLAAEGVMCPNKKFDMILDYMVRAVHEIGNEAKVENMRMQFGWADNDSKFIIGEREITAEGTFYSPPSSVTEDIAANMHTAGTLEKWREVIEQYDQPGLEGHAFGFLTAFGAPLFKFTGQSGAAVNLIHPDSGTGKTTVLRSAASVFGHPERLISTHADTDNARITKLGIFNNLLYCVDEITNMKAMAFSDLLYAISTGKGKDRMESNGNRLRQNHTKWQTMTLCSANTSFYEKLASEKIKPDGEMMRMLEYKIEPSSALKTEHAKQLFDFDLPNNYGHAGLIYAEYIVKNKELVVRRLREVQAKIDRELQLTARERFWSAGIASNITGGLIAIKTLKLFDMSMPRIYQWATAKMLSELRQDVKPPVTTVAAVVGDYVNEHINNILVVNDAEDKRMNLSTSPIVEPKGELLIRFEPDTKLMFLTTRNFRNYCVKNQLNYKDTIAGLTASGVYKDTANKRMTKGMAVSTLPVSAVILDTSVVDFLPIEDMIPAPDASDASGGS